MEISFPLSYSHLVENFNQFDVKLNMLESDLQKVTSIDN